MQFRVGAMVFASLIVTAILVVMFGELPTLIHDEYTIEVVFDNAPGVTENTPVRKSGIFIGRVTKVAFAKDAEGREDTRVVVTAAIQAKRKLYHNEICYVQSSLLGDASLEFIRSDDPKLSTAPILYGDKLKGRLKMSPMSLVENWEDRISDVMGTVNTAGKALTVASEDLGAAAKKVGNLLDEHKENIDDAIAQAATLTKSINNIIGEPETQAKLRQAVQDLPDTLNQLRNTMSLAETNLENLKNFTEPLGTDGRQRVDQIFRAADQLETLMTQMALFSRKLNSREGSLAMLIEDRQLYNHLNRAARNIDELTRQLKPIVADARVFSDKIARHPELLGVRGAMQRNPGIK